MNVFTKSQKPSAGFSGFSFFLCCCTSNVAEDNVGDMPSRPDSPPVKEGIEKDSRDSGVATTSDRGRNATTEGKKADDAVHFADRDELHTDSEDGVTSEEDADGDGDGGEQREQAYGTQGELVPFNQNRQLMRTEDSSSVSSTPGIQNQTAVAYCNLELDFDARKCEVSVRLVSLTEIRKEILDSVKLEHLDLIKLHIALLPQKSERATGPRSLSSQVLFGNVFTFTDVQPNQLSLLGLRIRAYRSKRHRRSTMIGETTLPFLAVKFGEKEPIRVAMDARKTLEELDSLSRSNSSRGTPRAVRNFAENVLDTLETGMGVLPAALKGGQSNSRALAGTDSTRSSSRSLPVSSFRSSGRSLTSQDPETVSNAEGRALAVLSDQNRRSSLMTVVSSTSSSIGAKRRAGEMQLGLSYVFMTGRMTVTVIKAANLTASEVLTPSRARKLAKLRRANKLEAHLEREAPDTYAEVELATVEGSLASSRTTVRRRQTDPTYQEDFVYDVPTRALDEVTVTITIYKQTKTSTSVLGWIAFGKQNSGVDEATHWADMRANRDQTVVRWHTLLK